MSSNEETTPIEFPRISLEITADIDDLRLRALRGEDISVEEYRAAIVKLRDLFGKRIMAREADVKPKRTAKGTSRKTPTSTFSLEDLKL